MKLDDVKKLHQKKYRELFAYYLVEGEHLLLELQKFISMLPATAPELKHIQLYVTQQGAKRANECGLSMPQTLLSEKQMLQLSDTQSPQGMIACIPMSIHKLHRIKNQRFIYLHEVQDPGNLGTIIRTLAWFGNFSLLLSKNSVSPFNSKVVRASMGAIFHVPIEQDLTLDDLKARFDSFAYLDMHGHSIGSSDFQMHQCYLFGNEARGVPSTELSTLEAQAYTIKGCGVIDSLNLASAVNICVYQLSRNVPQ